MSFGVAFAFPAYDNPPNVGPFTQAGPTLSLNLTGAQYAVWDNTTGALTAKTFSQIITFTRASTATYFDSTGTLQSAAIDAPRFGYNPTTLASLGFLVEGTRTNLVTYSEQFDNAAWTKNGSSITVNAAVAPSGVSDADGLIEDTATSAHSTSRIISFTPGTSYSLSIFAKEISGSAKRYLSLTFPSAAFTSNLAAVFDLSAGVSTTVSANATASILPVGNGWYRCSITATATITASASSTIRLSNVSTSGLPAYAGDGTSGLYIWGAQLEAGAFPTSYIPTTTAAVTRAADLAAVNTLSPWFNSSQGTLFAQFEASPNTFTAYVDISNGVTAQNSIHIDNDSGLMRSVYYSGSSAVATLSLGAIGTVGTLNKVASSYQLNNFTASRNGGSIVSDTAGALPVGLTQMNIGADPSGTASNVINGHIQRITYYPRSMPGYELQALTV